MRLSGTNEDESVEGRHQDTLATSINKLVLIGHGEEILHILRIQEMLDAHGSFSTSVGDAHGKPELFFFSSF